MGTEDEANRTLFVGNLDQRVTEELLFELFLQAGPLVRTTIPRDNSAGEGKRKPNFGFVLYKDKASVPYAVTLLDGTWLFGRSIHVQLDSGSTADARDVSATADAPNPHGHVNWPHHGA